MCRDSAATPGAPVFDRPLSTRFDEQDAFVIFDGVEIGSHNLLATPSRRNRINHHHRNVDRRRASALVGGILAAGRRQKFA